MDKIQHKFIKGLNLHITELGSSSNAIVFLNGFREIWFSWRHPMIVVAKVGFRAVAYDYRDYGLFDASPQPENTTFKDDINDLLAILDSLGLSKVFLVAKDWGARYAYMFRKACPIVEIYIINADSALMKPDSRILALKGSSAGSVS